MDWSSHAIPFAEFPEDLQLYILSFLSLQEIVAFAYVPSVCSGFWRLTANPSRSPPPHCCLSCSSTGNPHLRADSRVTPSSMVSLSRCSCGCRSPQATRS
ncbi:hypothetical protein CRG98_018627 [Punica granatum]|uniref:F-box domain-containing protein n=1 Tax=Punica granatum TaxID=22663 RepID=A0A2I0JXF6_PUNGR|nr:hypothetical protein CRG98_018627 [Punica granatum]